MNAEQLASQLIEQHGTEARNRVLVRYAKQLNDELALALKRQADYYLRTEVKRSQSAADAILQMATLTGSPRHRALGLLAWGNIYALGMGEYERAVRFYDEATDIYQSLGDRVHMARAQIGKIWALLNLSRYEDVETIATWASRILEEEGERLRLAHLSMNWAVSRARQGNDLGALAMFDRTRSLLTELGDEGQPYIPWVDQNRSIVLRNLGRLQESLEAAERAWRGMDEHGELVEAARARQSMAVTYLLLGRYTEAMTLMEEARRIFIKDGRQRDALLLDVFLCDCLLPLRRFQDVINITRNVRPFFSQRGMHQEIGKALIDEAVAFAGLGRFEEARASLSEARKHLAVDANPVLIATADLEQAAVLFQIGEFDACAHLLAEAERVFASRDLKPQLAQTWILQARLALRQREWHRAEFLAHKALEIAHSEQIITLAFRAHHVLGQVMVQRGERQAAMAQYERAIEHLERLHGYLMTEFQADFLEDKTDIYEDAVLLAVDMDDGEKALEMAERAKSRSLLNLITHRIDLSLRARNAEDEALVAKLVHLRRERDRILLRWETGEDVRSGQDARAAQQHLWYLEQQISQLWHQLLLHNADYARDALLWQVQADSPQPWLDAATLLVEFFIARGQVIILLVDQRDVQLVRVETDPALISRWLNMLTLNNRTFPWADPSRQTQLAHNAQGLLARLYDALLRPVRKYLDPFPRLIITPHGPLHYLPFHALFDGHRYLIETHEITYLPASSLLRFSQRQRDHTGHPVTFGFSSHGMLPYAPEEARRVAEIMGGEAFLEADATLDQVKKYAPRAQVVHFATHGEFRPDNPLFAGVLLADGWLTALDIFNLRLETSLITLSACETGQHRVGGGDELLGLTRSFLYAGAASLLLSYWQIPDSITFFFINDFYQHLAQGKRKATALREAQLALIHRGREGNEATTHFQHPFIWASFFLLGSPDPLEPPQTQKHPET